MDTHHQQGKILNQKRWKIHYGKLKILLLSEEVIVALNRPHDQKITQDMISLHRSMKQEANFNQIRF